MLVNGERLRLFSENSPVGFQASVYNVTTKTWIAPSERVDDIEEGKDRAMEYARTYLIRTVNQELPPVESKRARSR